MNRNKYLPLTETSFYILLALCEPAHGYRIMQRVEELSDGQVRIAAGTLYGALENLLKQRLIRSLASDDSRRKVYGLTEEGREVLKMDVNRMKHMVLQAENLLKEADGGRK
ncbi:MAG: PadR family transcriptional regulator [Chloroflexi bacterium]|mgnify:CR=1 FL=1|jgi:DNA-binding PadR family transcriptional regulator|nr:PadR family transcriptional regulator [Chloroflexota bacterium]